jgi:hypothetical protein
MDSGAESGLHLQHPQLPGVKMNAMEMRFDCQLNIRPRKVTDHGTPGVSR